MSDNYARELLTMLYFTATHPTLKAVVRAAGRDGRDSRPGLVTGVVVAGAEVYARVYVADRTGPVFVSAHCVELVDG